MNSKSKNIIGWVILSLVVVAVLYSFYLAIASRTQATPGVTAFAQCLASKNITMYGAVWCPHCQKQKALFGAAFHYVPYVECPDNTKLCEDKGVTGYPTWITASGTKLEGEQSLEKLAEVTQCALPTSN
ncbi:MAG: protein disulfide isomerase family protein [bacterium]